MKAFNIRVYGLLINNREEILITDEFRFGKEITKFPGGGLIWGEGTMDCLKREFKEELNCEIEILKHFYTTAFFQVSAFTPNDQIISIYYMIKNTTPLKIKISIREFDFEKTEGAQAFRWLSFAKIVANTFTFPIDKIVGEKLKDYLPVGK